MSHITYYTFKWNLSCLPGKFKWTGNNQPTFLLHICFSSYSQLFSPRFSFCLYHSSLTSANSFQLLSGAMPNQPISTLQLHHRGDQLQQTIEVAHFPAFSSNLAVFESKSKQTQQKNNPQKKKPKKQLFLPSVIPQPAYSIKAYSLVQRDLHTRVTPLSAVLWITRMPNIAWSKIHEHSLFPCIKTLEALPSKPLGWMLT